MFDEKEFSTYLLELIKKEVRKEIKDSQIITTKTGKVVNVGAGTLDVTLPGSETILTNLKNKVDADVTVNIDDEVIIVCLKGSMSNSLVAWRK